MRIGIGIPNTVPGVSGPLILDWARRAEERGFAFVSTIGRVGYPSYDSLTALAAVAGATSRLGLTTNAVLGPTYPDAVLAKITATVAQLSAGRLTLGLGVGARESDYLPAERDFADRGAAFDRQLEFLHRAWGGEPVAAGDFADERRAVAPPGEAVPVLIGGHGKRAVRRTARWGAGWTGAAWWATPRGADDQGDPPGLAGGRPGGRAAPARAGVLLDRRPPRRGLRPLPALVLRLRR